MTLLVLQIHPPKRKIDKYQYVYSNTNTVEWSTKDNKWNTISIYSGTYMEYFAKERWLSFYRFSWLTVVVMVTSFPTFKHFDVFRSQILKLFWLHKIECYIFKKRTRIEMHIEILHIFISCVNERRKKYENKKNNVKLTQIRVFFSSFRCLIILLNAFAIIEHAR